MVYLAPAGGYQLTGRPGADKETRLQWCSLKNSQSCSEQHPRPANALNDIVEEQVDVRIAHFIAVGLNRRQFADVLLCS
jgi:hypothetical protein